MSTVTIPTLPATTVNQTIKHLNVVYFDTHYTADITAKYLTPKHYTRTKYTLLLKPLYHINSINC